MKRKFKHLAVKIAHQSLFLFVFVVSFSCIQNEKQKTSPTITVSILPQKYLVEQIAGNQFYIEVLIPPGASPVTYEPLPTQLIQIKKSVVYFQIGHLAFEDAWTNKIKTVNPDLKIVDLSEEIDLVDENSGHDHVNPHIWMSPTRMKKMAKTVAESLKQIEPQQHDLFEANLRQFSEKLDSTDADLKSAFEKTSIKSFFIYHPALTYFAQDYGLKEYSLEKEGKEPSPKDVAELINVAKEENIKTVLIQKQFDQNNASTLAKEIGAKIVIIDPLSENWMREIAILKNVLTEY